MAASDDVPTYETLTIDNAFIESWSAVGESIFYRKADQTLHFVDIRRHLLHRVTLTPDDNELSLWSNHVVIHTKDAIGVAAEVEGNTDLLVIGAKYGFAVVEIETGEMKYVARVYTSKADAERFRMNDGAIDSRGRLWAGTMRDGDILDSPTNPHHYGSLFRLDPSGQVSVHMEGTCGVPNGLGWSPDDRTMYWTDSVDATIYAFDFSIEQGTISNRRVFVRFDDTLHGKTTEVPDGLCVDAEGCVWTAMYEGGRVLRISPQGRIVKQIKVPAWRVSCPCFGGRNMDELFLTSIELDSGDEDHKREYGQDGNVLRIRIPGVDGLPKNRFGQAGGLNLELFSL